MGTSRTKQAIGEHYPNDVAERIVVARVMDALPVWYKGGRIGIPFHGWDELGVYGQYPLIHFYVLEERERPHLPRIIDLFKVLAIRRLTRLWKDDPTIRRFYKPVDWASEWQDPRPVIPAAVKRAVHERDGPVCQQCGSTDFPSLDHIHPYSKGGQHTIENLQVLCRSCNSRKGNRITL